MKNKSRSLQFFLQTYQVILGEGAVIERLRRSSTISLDEYVVNSALIYQESGRTALEAICRQYMDTGQRYNLPLLLSTPTWRAGKERIAAAGLSGRDLNGDNFRFLDALRSSYGEYAEKIIICGLMSCSGDAYQPGEAMREDEATQFHTWQAEALANAGVDFLLASTLPALSEAIGIARAFAATALPYLISFVARPEGTLLDGTPLKIAISTLDAAVTPHPVAYLINCTHASVFRTALLHERNSSPMVRERVIGLLANTASLTPEELDANEELIEEEPEKFGKELADLHRDLDMKILGGCCGTDDRHIECLAKKLAANVKLIVFSFVLYAMLSIFCLTNGEAAELIIRIDNPPSSSKVVAMLFNSSSTFVDLRDPVKVITLPSGGATPGRIPDLVSGEYALVVYSDENGNGRLDENFIGIPNEPLGFSNRYWPNGPPTFTTASFKLQTDETKTINVKLQSIFGKAGILSLGVGVISNMSAYRDAKNLNVQPIPAISYIGDRLQILGLTALYGMLDWSDFALAATASYRFGAYSEKESSYLQGMGSRKGTVLGGMALQYKLPDGFKLSAGYEHDLLGRSSGGIGHLNLEKGFQQNVLTISPKISLNWLTDKLTEYEYGVSTAQARPDRPAYHPGDAVNLEAGITFFRELFKNWQAILSSTVVFLPSNLKESPIVDRSHVLNLFTAVTRQF